MKTTDFQAAVVMLKGVLPSLDELGNLLTRRDDLVAGIDIRTAALAALGNQIDATRSQMLKEQQAAEAALQRVAQAHAVALNLVDAKLKDLQRSQEVAETALTKTRTDAAQGRAQQADTHAALEGQHEARVAALLRQERDAGTRLAAIQSKIKALHGDLAGLSAS